MGIRLARHFMHAEELRAFLDAADALAREREFRPPRRDGLVHLAHAALTEQRLVAPARGALHREQHQPGGVAVDAVDRRQLGQAKLALEPHQQRVLQVGPGRHDRQKVRLVRHHQVFVLEQHGFLERNTSLAR